MRLPNPLQALARPLVRRFPVPILGGPNRGRRWSLGSTGRGYWTGRFEPERVDALLSLVRPGDCAWDIGAHKGYVALALAGRVGESGAVVACEPSETNHWFVARHASWNRLDYVHVVHSAVGGRDGRESFGGDTSLNGRLGEGPETVRVATVRHLIEVDGLPAPDLLKIDAEESEGGVLRGMGDTLSPDMILFIAIHSAALYEECRALLQTRGFRLFDSRPLAEQRDHPSRPWLGDPDLLAVGANRDLTDDDIRSLPFFAG